MPDILWVDDEIHMLKGHLLFLEGKGYTFQTCNNGSDAIELFNNIDFDAVFLDENMPGLSGLEVLEQMKLIRPETPIVMITKSEEEQIMEMAIGSKIADYLIKPVNPNQVLLCLKKLLKGKELVSKKATRGYQQVFGKLTMEMQKLETWQEWSDFYRELLKWELELEKSVEEGLKSVLSTQKSEANELFSRFISNHYEHWFESNERPMLSHEVVGKIVAPKIKAGEKVFLVVVDNLRLDQWMVIKPMIAEDFNIKLEGIYSSILPSATKYARNALFAGMLPLDIKNKFPKYWKEENEAGSLNEFEEELFREQMKSLGLESKNVKYTKVTNIRWANKFISNIHQNKEADVAVLVYNFVDTLSHARTDVEVIKELASDDNAYRRVTATWFEGSPLRKALKWAARNGFKVVLTTDHGTVNVNKALKVVGTRDLTTNLRFKNGNGISFQEKHSFVVKKPEKIGLPKNHIADEYIFALSDYFYAYPNNFNHYVNYYRNSYQHGGVSLEELIIPYVILEGK